MEQKRKQGVPEAVRAQLLGKRIILGGTKHGLYRQLLHALTKESEADGACSVSEETAHMTAQDYVILSGEAKQPEDLELLLAQLALVAEKNPVSAVLVTENAVYGKLFGEAHPQREHEIGYACHTSAKDRPVTDERLAEHLAWRLAKEGAALRIARMETADSEVEPALAPLLQMLLCGVAGEVYNLPSGAEAAGAISPGTEAAHTKAAVSGEGDTCVQAAFSSPLSPMRIYTDDTKFRTLCGV